jgi:hypothetical protein
VNKPAGFPCSFGFVRQFLQRPEPDRRGCAKFTLFLTEPDVRLRPLEELLCKALHPLFGG